VLEPGDILAALKGKPPEPLAKGPVRPARKGGTAKKARKAGQDSPARGRAGKPGAPGDSARTAVQADMPLPEGPTGRILGALRSGPQHPDELAQAAGLSIEQALGLLLELELSGEIVQTADHGYALP
jgi:predicted Rossmann fold nucleotide-binding protein DprA/Smf involved in DNA uptake